jgi:hypothetical protein
MRDFLIQLKEFSAEDNSELWSQENAAKLQVRRQESASTKQPNVGFQAAQAEQLMYRASVPGLLKPSEIDDDDEL